MNQFSEIIQLLDNSTNYYIICTNMAGKYSYINKNYSTNFSHVDGNFVGKDFFITMHPDDLDKCRAAGIEAISNKDALIPITIRKHDGQGGYVITQWEFKGMFEDDGTPSGVFCLGYDITEFIKKLEGQSMLLDEIAFSQSHVIRRPVANILGAINLLNDIELPDNAKGLMTLLYQSTQELDAVIRKVSSDIHG